MRKYIVFHDKVGYIDENENFIEINEPRNGLFEEIKYGLIDEDEYYYYLHNKKIRKSDLSVVRYDVDFIKEAR